MSSAGIRKHALSSISFPKSFARLLGMLILCMSGFEAKGANFIDSIIYEVGTRASFAGGENTPFWLVSNLHGLGSPLFNNGFVKGKIEKPISSDKKLSWGLGAEIAAGWHLPGAFRAQQLFAELRYRKLWLMIGAKDIRSEHNNPHLSTGDLLFSGNALPVPQIRVGTYGYAPFWGTKGWFSVKLYLSYGMFTDAGWQRNWVAPGAQHNSNVLFCGRELSLKFGNEEVYPLTLDVGIEMGTQFGGKIYFPDGKILKMPTRLIDWLKAIVPLSGGADTPVSEQTNVQGNMNGEYSIGLNWAPARGWKIKTYWEHYFEDHSQLTFEYGLWKDGLYGLELSFPKNPVISRFVYEYIGTKDQTGPINHDSTPEIPEQVSGGDNYFNHHLYSSWQTWGMSIGTPLAISPLYNRNHYLQIYNTRFIANHFAMEGDPMPNLKWRLLLTFSNNWGTYRYPFPEVYHNCSGLVELGYHAPFLKGLFVKGALAWDHGQLLGNNFGGMIAVGFEGLCKLSNKK